MDINHKGYHRNRFQGREILLSINCFFIILGLSVAPTWACDEPERQETLQIVHDSLDIGWKIGMSGNFQQFMPQLNELTRRAQNLSPSCQALLRQISGYFEGVYNPNTTQCQGGVCCDSTGCY